MAPEFVRMARNTLTNGAFFSPSSAKIQFREWAMRFVCTRFPVRLGPSLAVRNVAHNPPRNGCISGTTPATKESAPARDRSCFFPTTGLLRICLMRSVYSVTLSSGMETIAVLSSSRASMVAPIHFTFDPASDFSSFRGKPVTAVHKRILLSLPICRGSRVSKTKIGSSTKT